MTVRRKLGTAFHAASSLSRPAISELLQWALENASDRNSRQKNLTFESIRAGTSLSTGHAKGMRRYAFGCSLLDANDHATAFGRLVARCNRGLSFVATQWLMHYHLAAPHRNGPAFWNHLIVNCLRPGDTLTAHSVAEQIAQYLDQTGAKPLAKDTVRGAATAFLGTYSKADALGGLGLLLPTEDKQACRVAEPVLPETAVFAYALADYWQTVWQDRNSVNLSAVLEAGGPAALFLLGSGETRQILREMQAAGQVQLQRSIPPYQVVRLWESPEALLEQVYA